VLKLHSVLVTLVAALILSGCVGGGSPQENIYNVLEETVKKEKGFEKVQEPLVELEKKEQEIFKKVIGLGMKEMDQIKELSNQALENIEKREKYITNEVDSMNEAKKEFEKVNEYIGKIEEDSLKNQAKKLQEIMEDRFENHEQLAKSYKEALEKDKKLYEMLKKEDLTMEQLQKQIAEINKTYEEVLSINKKYNDKTDQFNNEKLSFYKSAGIETNQDSETALEEN
jgi:DNA repair exonuclease SbcCD ATPase subunit